MDEQRALLDELMGKERDVPAEKKRKLGVHFSDPDICKYYICGFCPNSLFTNTKSDLGNPIYSPRNASDSSCLGACTKEHDDTAKEQ